MCEIIKGIENLKKQYNKAKIICGDYRGMKNRFEIAAKNGIDVKKIMFESMGGAKGRIGQDIGKVEVITEVFEDENSVGTNFYRMVDLLKDVKTYGHPIRIEFSCNEWNKSGTDANSRILFEIEYINS